MNPVSVIRGEIPLVLAFPHCSTWLPDEAAADLNETGLALADTDWHVDRLYEGLIDGASVVRANFSRYLIDANRDPSGESLYPGRNTTGLCPTTDFDGRPIHVEGREPRAAEVAARLYRYHAPYHDALSVELDRICRRHGSVILYDCHSIRSVVPFLFDGKLPDLNIGTNGGASCVRHVESAVVDICRSQRDYTHVTNGRFKGGWTTRRYGRPGDGVHAIQMELAQCTYLREEAPPFAYSGEKAARLRTVLASILENLAKLGISKAGGKGAVS